LESRENGNVQCDDRLRCGQQQQYRRRGGDGAGGGEVFFPAGTGYRVNSALTNPNSEVSFVGEGWEASKIRADFNGDTLTLSGSESQQIVGLGFQPRRAKASGHEIKINNCLSIYLNEVNIFDDLANGWRPSQGIGMLAAGSQYKYFLEEVQVNGCAGEGAYIGAAGGGLVQGVWISNCEFARNYDGLVMFNGGGIIIQNTEFLANTHNGLASWVGSGDELAGVQVIGGFPDSNGNIGVAWYSNGGYVGNIMMSGVSVKTNTVRGMDIGTNVQDVQVNACEFANNGQQGLYIDGLRVDVNGCRVARNGTASANVYDGCLLGSNSRSINLVGNRFGGKIKNASDTQKFGFAANAGSTYSLIGNVGGNNLSGDYYLGAQAPVVNSGNW